MDCDSILPFVSVMYLFASLTRGNIGNARLGGIEKDLDINGKQFHNIVTMFFVGYIICQIPSTMATRIVPPSKWIGFVMVIWVSANSKCQLGNLFSLVYPARFFMGCFQAGLGPGVPLLLSYWYKREEMARRMSIFLGSSTLAGLFGGVFAYAVIRNLDGSHGLASWRWLFIVEGVPTIFIGILCFFFLPNYPHTASKYFLTPAERELAIKRGQSGGNKDTKTFSKHQMLKAVLDWHNWLAIVVYLGLNVCLSSFSTFLPTIIKAMGFTSLQAELLTIPPYATGCFTLVLVSWLSDLTKQRAFCIMVTTMVAALGYILLIIGKDISMKYAGAILVGAGVYPIIPLTLTWISNNNLGHTKRGTALAMTGTVAQCFSILGSQIYKKSQAPTYREGHGVCLAFMCLSFCMALLLRIGLARENCQKDRLYGKVDEMQPKVMEDTEKLYDKHPSFRYFL
ncbi:MFS general substrate transporter [Basidiobolus meristosporus CBS 931.73]|uniref:MFS general substrate transporter n=1 Tax=Basidiobolus meristosporus CBS 931.73 TaxID=1314790 RepID=A0A1Y1YU91_9FUNG|nr:MFS general substrate transporter [Basidiobolus meristosporus CBS 931.73]|eukprot:ORY01135.1 MFS general substrate transporter [Basidiobolus meristosporus CBS 931.73]